ncbi:hypothetical protein B0H19DRAFT_1258674 [Mycena capillaripes]|nr:hypothetical protein B0H19DRAFT_1258674 [Mycena capillaripes]
MPLPYIIVAIIYLCLIFCWLYRRFFKSPSGAYHRRLVDDGGRYHAYPDRLGQFTLVAFYRPRLQLNLHRLPGISPTQFTAFLAALDLKEDLISLRVLADSALNLPGFLSLYPVYNSETRGGCPFGTHHIPQQYISRTFSTQSTAQTLVITSASNPSILSLALAAIANASLRELTLASGSTGSKGIPWRTDPDIEAGSALHGVARLTLIVWFRYRAADAQALPRWLGRFPQLQRLDLHRHRISPRTELSFPRL